MAGGAALGLLLAAAGCRRHDAPAPTGHAANGQAANGRVSAGKAAAGKAAAGNAAVVAAEDALRNTVQQGRAAQFRGLQVYDQALPRRWAVCGQVSPFTDDPALFVPFVAVLTVGTDGRARAPDLLFAGTTVDDADRTYAALITHCYGKGGPSAEPMQGVPPLPPLPNAVPAPQAATTAAAPARSVTAGSVAPAGTVAPGPGAVGTGTPDQGPGAAPDRQVADGEAVTRQNVNMHASPHGAVTRVVPQGTALHVFAAAPGGWLQVGDTAPQGWIHESMLDRRQAGR